MSQRLISQGVREQSSTMMLHATAAQTEELEQRARAAIGDAFQAHEGAPTSPAHVRELSTLAHMGGLTSEGIIALMQTRVRDLDTQVQNITDGIEANAQAVKDLSDEIGLWRDRQSMIDGHVENDGRIKMNEEISLTPERATELGVPVQADGTYSMRDLCSAWGLDGEARASDLQNRLDGLNEDLRSINSGNETALIQLQTLMQQRSSAIELSTNMLKQMDQSMDAIVGNMR